MEEEFEEDLKFEDIDFERMYYSLSTEYNSVTESNESLRFEVNNLRRHCQELEKDMSITSDANVSLRSKISQIEHILKGIGIDDCSEPIKEIAEVINFQLMKRIAGRGIITFTYSGEVPIDFNTDDIEIFYTIDSNDVENMRCDEDDVELDTFVL